MDGDGIPVTVLAGSLGAGKTTLLNRLLENVGDRDIAVLVNDMGEMNVDADLVSSRSERAVGSVTELSNGCICCELRDDLATAVVRLARRRDFDHLVVEASGISEPGPVARLFTTGSSAAALYEVDAVVTVVDARLFFDTFEGDGAPGERIAAATAAADGREARPLADLLVEQVELANVVLLNKADLVSESERDAVSELVAALRPDAETIPTVHSAVDPDRILGVGLYDPATAAEAAGWRRLLESDEDADGHGAHDHEDADGHDHAHPAEVYGVASFTYRARRPFHPRRLESFLSDLPRSVVRSKGTAWVAGREDAHLTLGQAGPSVRVEAEGRWIASLPEFERDAYRDNRPDLAWDEEWGDRRVELVFIGTGMDEASLRDRLDDCLLTDAEMATDWAAFENPFPATTGETLVVTEPAPGA